MAAAGHAADELRDGEHHRDRPDYRPTEPGAINGGLFQRPKEAPGPVIYVGVESVDDAIKKVQAAGGKVVTPRTPIPGMGAYGRVSDTEGNVLGLFEAAM